MAIRVRFQGGPRAGEAIEFGDDLELIPLGRDPEKCKVVFPSEQTSVGREHCALKRVLGRYVLILNRDNPVFVNGAPARAEQTLDSSVDLQLGKNGPRLVVETLGNENLPRTMDQGGGHTGQGTLIENLTKSVKTHRVLLGVAILVIAAVAGYAWWGVREARVEFGALLEKNRKDLQVKVKEAEPKIQEALTRSRKSVYLVLRRNAKGQEMGVGTAWVGAKGILATNAHVAVAFDKLEPGETLFVRSTESPPRDFTVVKTDLHPGYLEFQQVWREYTPVQVFGLSTQLLRNIPACDVALMHVEQGEGLADPIPLEPLDGLRKLQAGDVAGYVGFPMENMALGGANLKHPSPQTHVAHLTNLTDYFLVQSLNGDGHLVQHALPLHGGASGSPILNARGNVTALLSAGNMMAAPEGRAPLGVNVNFGQRVDLLQELLDGTAQKAQEIRTARWKKDIRQYSSLKDEWQTLADRWAAEWAKEIGVAETVKVVNASGGLDQYDSAGLYYHSSMLTLPGPGRYLLVAINLSAEPLGVLLEEQNGRVVVEPTFTNFFVLQPLEAPSRVQLSSHYVGGFKGAQFVAQLYRARD